MKIEELVKLGNSFNLESYNINSKYLCFKGINGQSSLIYVNQPEKLVMMELRKHIQQIGRDTLKMEINNLLDITKHN